MSFDLSTPSDATWRIDIPHVFGLCQENIIEDEAVRRKRYIRDICVHYAAMQLEGREIRLLAPPVRSSVILSAPPPQFGAETVSEDAICPAFLQKRRVSKQATKKKKAYTPTHTLTHTDYHP